MGNRLTFIVSVLLPWLTVVSVFALESESLQISLPNHPAVQNYHSVPLSPEQPLELSTSLIWEEFELFYIDSIFNIVNKGVTRIFAQLNEHQFLLTTLMEDTSRGDNIFLIPLNDTIVFNIADYLILDTIPHSRNLLRLSAQGPPGSDATIIVGDQALKEVDFRLKLNELPVQLELRPNYPNPFNEVTHIQFTVPRHLVFGTRVRLEIYNVLGQRVRTLVDDYLFPGRFVYRWDGRNASGQISASGFYVYRLVIGERQTFGKILYLR